MSNPSGPVINPEWKQLLDLGEQLAEQPTPQDQCNLIIQTVSQMLSARVQIWLVSPIYPLPGMPDMETLPDAPATPLAHQAQIEKTKQLETSASTADPGPRSIAIPLVANHITLGVLQADRDGDRPFSDHDISLLEGLIAHAAIAMELTRQETLKNWRYEQLTLVSSVSAQISSFTNLETLYDQVTQLIQEAFDYYYVAIFILDEGQKVLRFRGSASHTTSKPLKPDFFVELGRGIIGTVGKTGVEVVAPDVNKEPLYRHLDALPETLSEAALPLKIENRILGVLDFQGDKRNAFHQRDMLVLRSLAEHIALAIESKHLYSSLERRAEQISSVFEVTHALTSLLDLDELLDEVVRLIQNRFGYPFVHVYSVHPGRRLVIYQTGSGERSKAMKEEGRHYALDASQGLIPWVARNRETFLCNDVSQEPLYLPYDLPPYDTRSELTVPLKVGEEILGVLDIQSREVNAFDENDRSLFESLAASVAVAIRNANLYRSEQWRRKVAESFRDVAQMISASMPLNQVLDIILLRLEDILPCEAAAIWLVQEDATLRNPQTSTPRLRLAAYHNLDVDKVFEALQNDSVLAMLDRALQNDQPLIRKPGDPAGPLGEALSFNADYSSIAAPLRTGDRSLGLLSIAHHQDGRYGSEAQAITATFASHAAVAIQNARLYSNVQEQALISTMLLQVAEASQSIMTVEDLLSTMIRLSRLLMGVKKCAFMLWEDSLQSFNLKAWYGFELPGESSGLADTDHLFSPNLPALTRLRSSHTLLYLDDPAIELNLPELGLPEENGTIIMLPLLVRREVIGAFLVSLQTGTRLEDQHTAFDPKALAILQGIAHQTSMTIDNLRLLEARQEEAYVTAALLQVAQAVVTSTDLNDTLDTIVHLLPILVGIETCAIYLWDETNQLFRPTQVSAQSRREEEKILAHAYTPGSHQLLDTIRQSGQMHMCRITNSELSFESWGELACQPFDERTQSMSALYGDWVIGYPLSLQNQVMGALIVRETNASPTFWERRMEIIHGIAQQTSLAIQNDIMNQEMVVTERIEREMQLARQIQETFLPENLPNLKHWELDLRWETAREIGGDFYDAFLIGENKLCLVIADVADKGLPAALYMTVSRTLIRANANNYASPARVLEEVNKQITTETNDSMFITAVYAILSLDTGELLYANAGHNLPLLYHAQTGNVEQLPKGGIAMGILDPLNLQDHPLTIQPGDVLLLYTDGVTDLNAPNGEFFGQDRLCRVIQDHGKEKIQDLLEALDDEMIEFRRGVPPADDVTVLAIRRKNAYHSHAKPDEASFADEAPTSPETESTTLASSQPPEALGSGSDAAAESGSPE